MEVRRNGKRKITADDVAVIKALRAQGLSRAYVAAQFGATPQTVTAVTAGKRDEVIITEKARLLAMARDHASDECLIWDGSTSAYGYPVVWDQDTRSLLIGTRVALAQELNRELNPKEDCCHTCDTPSCFNPRHLFPGSRQDNVDDMIAKGRGRYQK